MSPAMELSQVVDAMESALTLLEHPQRFGPALSAVIRQDLAEALGAMRQTQRELIAHGRTASVLPVVERVQ